MLDVMLFNGSTYQVANPELAKDMNRYIKADKQERQGQWLKAYAIANVMTTKSYETDGDFSSLDNFLESPAIGLSKKTAQKYLRVVTFKEANKDLAGIDYLTINSIDALNGIEDLDKFIKWLAKSKKHDSFDGISESMLLEYKREWIEKQKAKANKKAGKETETEETETEATEVKEAPYIVFEYKGKKYKLDMSIFETLEEVK